MSGVFTVRPRMTSPGKRGVLWMVVTSVVLAALVLAGANNCFRPALPIAVTYRPSFDGTSLVAQFHNTSVKYLDVAGTFESGGKHQTRSVTLNIGPYQTRELGWAEGWAFMSGETIRLQRDGYRSVVFRVP